MPVKYTSFIPHRHAFKTELQQLAAELNDTELNAPYAYAQHPKGREILRQRLRRMHGNLNARRTADIVTQTELSPIHQILRNNTEYAILPDGDLQTNIMDDGYLRSNYPALDPKSIKERQQNVEVFYDPAHLTPEEVYDIQLLKAGASVQKSGSFNLDDYIASLESKGCYLVVRGVVKQYFLMDETATVLAKPRTRVLYYTNFPKLANESGPNVDLEYFTRLTKNGRKLRGDRKNELKIKYKDIIRLNIQVAASFHEGFDVVTPHAFLSALPPEEQQAAKQLFAKAVIEVALEEAPAGFQGLFVHEVGTPYFANAIQQYQHNGGEFKTALFVGSDADASAPQLAAKNLALPFNIAEAVMGAPCGPAGNFALSDFANQAKEENDARVMCGEMEMIFGPQNNNVLLNKLKYKTKSCQAASEFTADEEIIAVNDALLKIAKNQMTRLDSKLRWYNTTSNRHEKADAINMAIQNYEAKPTDNTLQALLWTLKEKRTHRFFGASTAWKALDESMQNLLDPEFKHVSFKLKK
jgi:hypothetical protein